MNSTALYCLGLASSLGARTRGSEQAPAFLKEKLNLSGLEWRDIVTLSSTADDTYTILAQACEQFASATSFATSEEPFFFVFGGDHSIAMGTWSGVAEAIAPKGDLGLIWFDAHMDSHTPSTTHSGFIHGMPLAALMGYGDERFTQLLSKKPKLKPENVFLIGIRDFEPEEYKLLCDLNVRIYFIEEVLERGLPAILEEVLDALAQRTAGYGVSFDLDALDPTVVKATGTPVPNGISIEEAMRGMEVITARPPVAFELVEYNPLLDSDGETLAFIQQLLADLQAKIWNNITIPA